MTQTKLAILLATAMIAIALLSVVDILPEEAAQYAPFLLLVMFPNAWLRGDTACRFLTRSKS